MTNISFNNKELLCENDFKFNLYQFRPNKYVDKTAIIADLIQKYPACSLCRPRRFGKTSTLKTIADLFSNGLKNWQGCAIAQNNLWQEEKCPVLFFSFAGFPNDHIDSFKLFFCYHILSLAKQAQVDLSQTPMHVTLLLNEFFNQTQNNKVVILIDEYDLPLIKALHNPDYYQQVQNELASFYEFLKSKEDQIRFMMVSGVNRLSNLSIFSGFNNITDISFLPDYASIVGYTEQELLVNFEETLTKIAQGYQLSPSELMQQLKINYNGYCFDQSLKQTVFNTWDINKFVTDALNNRIVFKDFKAYWADEGALSSFVIKYFAQSKNRQNLWQFLSTLITSQTTLPFSKITEKVSFLETDLKVFLLNAGYLTLNKLISDIEHKNTITSLTSPCLNFAQADPQYLLDFPNQQVKHFVLDNLISKVSSFLLEKEQELKLIKQDVYRIFNLNSTSAERERILTEIIVSSGVNSQDCFTQESQLRTLLIVLFKACDLKVQFEVSKVQGRIDLIVQINDSYFIIELKVFKSAELKIHEDNNDTKDHNLNKEQQEQMIAKMSKDNLNEALWQIKDREYTLALNNNLRKYFMAIVGDCSSGKITAVELKTQAELDKIRPLQKQKKAKSKASKK